jgi:phosphatidylglycerophosphatase A
MRRLAWAFLVVNVAGFFTYHLLPAAPPWYFHEHGCVVNLATSATEGPALARVDALLGFEYFRGMYSKASSVFGALPSLHCAYPLLVVIEGWRSFGAVLRTVSVAYLFAMIFSAIYLDHHWVLDALLGIVFAAVAVVVVRRPRAVAWTIATWFGCGFVPIAPGTVGTLAALPIFFALRGFGGVVVLASALVIAGVGIWAAGVVADESKRHDPQVVVVDEVSGVLVTLALVPSSLAGVVCGVLLFRAFDVVKPFPAKQAERLPRGWGIVVDDLVAGVWAAVVFLALRALVGVFKEVM